MDPISQGVLGAVFSQAVFSRSLGRKAGLCGLIGGLLPDADVFIRSATDPLLGMEYHRHFSHALITVPIGGLVAMFPFLLTSAGRKNWKLIYAACTVGYATHAPLDILTSYGTLFLWPLTKFRLALDWFSIVDPIFTLPLLLLVGLAVWKKSSKVAYIGVIFALLYACFGGIQHYRAANFQGELLTNRGHISEKKRVMPTLGNLILWRSIYIYDGKIYADALRVPLFAPLTFAAGDSIELLTRPPLEEGWSEELKDRLRRDFERFQWFSDGYLAYSPNHPDLIADMRYSMRTQAFTPLWGIRFLPDEDVPISWDHLTSERSKEVMHEFWEQVTGHSVSMCYWYFE